MENHGREVLSEGLDKLKKAVEQDRVFDMKGAIQRMDAADKAKVTGLRSIHTGIGGAPTRCTTFPSDPAARKTYPVASGVLDYFPDAIAAIANVSHAGNEQHNPGQPLHWARGKSTDEADTMIRHFLERGTRDSDGIRHSAKMAWRALALLQKEIEAEGKQSCG